MDRKSRIFIAGDRSIVALDLKALLESRGYEHIQGCNRSNLDLRDSLAVERFFTENKPEIVFIVAAWCATTSDCRRVPFDVCQDNLLIAMNLLRSAIKHNVEKVIYISSDSALPWHEDGSMVDEAQLMAGPVKDRIEPYALAKLIGIKLCSYADKQLGRNRCTALVLPYIYGNIKKNLFYSILHDVMEAKTKGQDCIKIWGRPALTYNFLHSRDVASAACFLMENEMEHDCYIAAPEKPVSKKELVEIIAKETGYQGRIEFDADMPISYSVMASPVRLFREGWRPQVSLEEGIREVVAWYMGDLEHKKAQGI